MDQAFLIEKNSVNDHHNQELPWYICDFLHMHLGFDFMTIMDVILHLYPDNDQVFTAFEIGVIWHFLKKTVQLRRIEGYKKKRKKTLRFMRIKCKYKLIN